jgi:hypothetical protein
MEAEMWFNKRQTQLGNLDQFLENIETTNAQLIDWLKADALSNGSTVNSDGNINAPLLNDDVRLVLAEQLASIFMARENVMAQRGRKHLFQIRPVYVSLSPEDFVECTAKMWMRLWPNSPYPRYEELTREQRYFCFGPDSKKFDPSNRENTIS